MKLRKVTNQPPNELRATCANPDVCGLAMARTRPFPKAKLVVESNWYPRRRVPYTCPKDNGPSAGGAVSHCFDWWAHKDSNLGPAD